MLSVEPLSADIVSAISPQAAPVDSLLARYRLGDDEEAYIYESWQIGMRRCMENSGFEFEVLSLDQVQQTKVMAILARDVAIYGYNILPIPDPKPHTSTEDQLESDPAFQEAFTGDPDDPHDGCRDVAYDRVYGAAYWSLDDQVAQAISDSRVAAETTDAYVALDHSWSDCMKVRGFDYAKPDEPLSRFAGQPVTAEQVATRVADLNCQADVSYALRVSELENQHATNWIEEHQQLLEDLEDARRVYLTDLERYRQER